MAVLKEESSDVDLNGDRDDKFCVQSETESTHDSEDIRIQPLQIFVKNTIQQNRIAQNFTTFDAALGIVSIVLFYVDVVTDIMLAIEYFHQGHKLWFGLTTTFIVVPSIITCILNLRFYAVHDKKYRTFKYIWAIRLTMTLLMMGPVIRQIEYLHHGLKSRSKENKRDHDQQRFLANNLACQLRMFECVLEAAPQLVLQIYILTSQRQHESWHIEGRQVAAILSSYVGLVWSFVAYEKARRKNQKRQALKGFVFLFLYRASEIGPRVIALGLFASQFHFFVFIVTGVHFISMSIWLMFQKKLSYHEDPVYGTFFKLLVGMVGIFCRYEFIGYIKRYKVLVYYIIVVLENFIMIGFWAYFTDAKGEWFYIPTFFVMPLGLVLWLFSEYMYFGYFHPSGEGKIPYFHQMGINSCYQYLCHEDEIYTISLAPFWPCRHSGPPSRSRN